MTDTVYLIKGLEPDKKYEVKARMYSNAGIGPFSEPQLVTTSVGEKGFVFFFFCISPVCLTHILSIPTEANVHFFFYINAFTVYAF